MTNWGVKQQWRKNQRKSERQQDKKRRKSPISRKANLDDTYDSRASSSLAETYISTDSSFSSVCSPPVSPEYRRWNDRRSSADKSRSYRRGRRDSKNRYRSPRRDDSWRSNESDSDEESVYYEIYDSDEEEDQDDNYDIEHKSDAEEHLLSENLLDPFEYLRQSETESIMNNKGVSFVPFGCAEKSEEEDEATVVEEEQDMVNPFAIPSVQELSEELCRIVVGANKDISYSQFRRSALHSLVTLLGWAETRDPTFRKHFLTYGGVVKVLDFISEVLRDEEEHSQDTEGKPLRYRIAVECIRLGAGVVAEVCSLQEKLTVQEQDAISSQHSRTVPLVTLSTKFLAGITGAVIVDHGGMENLLLASDLCCRGRDKSKSNENKEESIFRQNNDASSIHIDPALEAAVKVWNAISNTCSCVGNNATTVIIEKLLVFLWDTGFDVLEAFPIDKSSMACPKNNDIIFLLRASVFRVFTMVLVRFRGGFHEKKGFWKEEDILSRALDVVSGNCKSCKSSGDEEASFATGISSISMSFHTQETLVGTKEEETYIEEALLFFCECQTQGLLFRKKGSSTISQTSESSQSLADDALDEHWKRLCEDVVPLCVDGLQKFAVTSPSIRQHAIKILDACLCSINKNTEQQHLLTQLTDGTLEALGPCLASESLEETEKYEIKEVVRKIAVVIYSVYIGEFGPSGICQEV